MLTFEEAQKLALKAEPEINKCLEYDKGYRFLVEDGISHDGDGEVIVIKEDGSLKTMIQFIHQYHPDPKYKEIPFK